MNMKWNLDKLMECPNYEVIDSDGCIQLIRFDNDPYFGKQTKVFAYIGLPEKNGPVPGVVLVHGGDGMAYKEWVALWNARGYAAIAMDTAGQDQNASRHDCAGPGQGYKDKFDITVGWENTWTYHAVASVIRSHSILVNHPRVISGRTAITGISWGGYLTCITASIDQRFKCAVPVYGCGFAQDNSPWLEQFSIMTENQKRQWYNLCDASVYLPLCKIPILFVSSVNDQPYPLDVLKKSYSLIKAPRTLSIQKSFNHGHQEGWRPREIHLFINSTLSQSNDFPVISPMKQNGSKVASEFACTTGGRGFLLYTEDRGLWRDRGWNKVCAKIAENRVIADVPPKATAYFLAIEDVSGTYVSSPYEEVLV